MSIIHSALKKAQLERQKEAKEIPAVGKDSRFVEMSTTLEQQQRRAIRRHVETMKSQEKESSKVKQLVWNRYLLWIFAAAIFFLAVLLFISQLGRMSSSSREEATIKESVEQADTIYEESATEGKQSVPEKIIRSTANGIEDKIAAITQLFSGKDADKFVCTGIFYDPQEPVCIINGSIVGLGEVIDDARVVRIERDRVVIRYEGEKVSLLVL